MPTIRDHTDFSTYQAERDDRNSGWNWYCMHCVAGRGWRWERRDARRAAREHVADCSGWPGADEPSSSGPMPTVTYNGTVYKVRSRKTEIPDLTAMDHTAVLFWLLRNTYPRGTNHRRPAPNLPHLTLTAPAPPSVS